jgi:hypothetical protein
MREFSVAKGPPLMVCWILLSNVETNLIEICATNNLVFCDSISNGFAITISNRYFASFR